MGISFIGIFIVIYNIFFWIFGLAHSLAWDYAPGVPQGEEAQRRVPWREKPIGSLVYRYLPCKTPPQSVVTALQKVADTTGKNVPTDAEKGEKATSAQVAASARPSHESTVVLAHTRLESTLSNPWFHQFLRTISLVFAPINLVIAGSLCIALIQPLKALFVNVSDEGGPSWKGPDGKPPLAFLMDTGLSTLTLRSNITILTFPP